MWLLRTLFIYTLKVVWFSGAGPLLRQLLEPQTLVVAYHSVHNASLFSDPEHRAYQHISIAYRDFVAQIMYLKRRGYQFVPFHKLAEQSHASSEKQKLVATYFDDGFRDILFTAYPFLKKHGLPATLFLAVDYLDQKKTPGAYLTWAEAAYMRDIGEYGSHSITHRKLTKILPKEVREEMAYSRRILEERLGVAVTSFSYPYGRSSQTLEALARETGYRITTASSLFRKIRPDPGESLAIFKWKALGLL